MITPAERAKIEADPQMLAQLLEARGMAPYEQGDVSADAFYADGATIGGFSGALTPLGGGTLSPVPLPMPSPVAVVITLFWLVARLGAPVACRVGLRGQVFRNG